MLITQHTAECCKVPFVSRGPIYSSINVIKKNKINFWDKLTKRNEKLEVQETKLDNICQHVTQHHNKWSWKCTYIHSKQLVGDRGGGGERVLTTSASILPNITIKSLFSEENYVPATYQLVQEIECRQGSFFTGFTVWWPWKLGQGHQNLINSFYYPNDTIHKVWP